METARSSLFAENDESRDSMDDYKLGSRSSTSHHFESFIPSSSGEKHRSFQSQKFDEYFLGPRELDRHSKWPMMLRIHGSCLPSLILPLTFVVLWTVGVFSIQPTLLTVLGFIVALALSTRSTSAYERTALNLIVAYSRALKHRLRFEPYTHYADLEGLVPHLDTYARTATALESEREPSEKGFWKTLGEQLGVSFAISNPRKIIKRAPHPLGNLPLEILNHLAVYLREVIAERGTKGNIYTTHPFNAVATMNDILETTDRILNTPLPLAYAIAISQLTWVYILILPFQLYTSLGMISIPGTLFAGYIILSFAYIGNELENPFGNDVNDLPLDSFCNKIEAEIHMIAASSPKTIETFVCDPANRLLHPLSDEGYNVWSERSIDDLREGLRKRAVRSMEVSNRRVNLSCRVNISSREPTICVRSVVPPSTFPLNR
ncbi:UPF0187-domain-containing protein [Periconia macrospinosa]|uniref:UPF0187-domain-containing protein n=1 Tax=Periconia macrospinosa TaxID=97972 RepID=A0A2V1DCW4_9PLEO|nr:UPF0187-domain-containing protein [Periconia macrospinosa]